jgi:hypothetical protein
MAGGKQSNTTRPIARMSSFDIFPEGHFCKGVNNTSIKWSGTNNVSNGTSVQTSFRHKI